MTVGGINHELCWWHLDRSVRGKRACETVRGLMGEGATIQKGRRAGELWGEGDQRGAQAPR